jgi:hypothetical protein
LVAAPKALRKRRISEEKEAKVLCFFFSKKKALLLSKVHGSSVTRASRTSRAAVHQRRSTTTF